MKPYFDILFYILYNALCSLFFNKLAKEERDKMSIKLVTNDDVRALKRRLSKDLGKSGTLKKLIAYALVYQGWAIVEMEEIKVGDIHLGTNNYAIVGIKNKRKQVLSNYWVDEYKQWLEYMRADLGEFGEDKRVFLKVRRNGTIAGDRPINAGFVGTLLRGIELSNGKVQAKHLRMLCAHRKLKRMDTFGLATFFGWTDSYANSVKEDLSKHYKV